MGILTHDRIKLDGTQAGALAPAKGLLWGQNAVQQIQISRNTPSNPVQAVSKLGVVDFTSAASTSDITIETVLVEGCDKAVVPSGVGVANSSAHRYANRQITLGVESYVLVGLAMQFSAGNPTSVSYNYITAGLATYLDTQDQPDPGVGEESDYAVVLGDDGSGIIILALWDIPGGGTAIEGFIPVIDENGALQSGSPTAPGDSGLKAGVQSIGMNCSINRDQVLDVRSTQPVQFVTQYPLNITMDMEVYDLPLRTGQVGPGEAGWDPEAGANFPIFPYLTDLSVAAHSLTKHRSSGPTGWSAPGVATAGDLYCKVTGLRKQTETESINVGSFLSYTVNYTGSDMVIPAPAIT
jgi:hypothetical protein